MFPPQTSWRRTKSTRLQLSYCFMVCVSQPQDLVHGDHALQHCPKTGRVIWQVCARSLNGGVCEALARGHACLSRLTPHYRPLHIVLQRFSLNTNIGIMKDVPLSPSMGQNSSVLFFAWLHTAIKCKKSNNPES